MSFDPVRIGVIGTGRFGILHAKTLLGLAESELVALVDCSEKALSELPEEFSGIPKYSTPEDALRKCPAEAWVVSTSTADHVQVASMLLEQDAHVLLEKPISGNLKEALKLTPLVSQTHGKLMLGHILLFNSEFRALQSECHSRGGFEYATCYRMRPAKHADDYPGETPFHLTMVHDLYCVQSLVNGKEPTHISAQAHYNQKGSMDLALAQFGWPDGSLATFSAGFLTPEAMSAEGFDRMEIFGKNWMARMHPNPRPLEVWDGNYVPPMTLEILTDSNTNTGMLAEELRFFCKVVRDLEPIPKGTRYQDGIQVMRWLDRLTEASENSGKLSQSG